MEWDKKRIINLLETNDKSIGRALIVLLKNQTPDEVSSMDTKHVNGKGFNAAHAKVGTSMAVYAKNRNGYLTQRQIDYWRKKDTKGNMRIGIYWKQLQNAIKENS